MNGVLVVDKPAGITSHTCVAQVKKILGVKKAGHTGTLDPMATGVLPICLGEATKIAPYLTRGDKWYRATMVLGIETDTLDVEGKILAKRVPQVSEWEVREVMRKFVGKIEQQPPYFSAVKYQGKPLHYWARRGIKVEVPTRTVEIYAIEIEQVDLPYVQFFLSCSSGTYVRVLCAEIGKLLGCGASLQHLRRLRSGPFGEEMAVSWSEIGKSGGKVISLNDALGYLPAIVVNEDWEERLKQGRQPEEGVFANYDISSLARGDMIKFCNKRGELIALAKWEGNGRARISRVFHSG